MIITVTGMVYNGLGIYSQCSLSDVFIRYGLEIQCVYQFYGPKPYIDKLREVIDSLKTPGLV